MKVVCQRSGRSKVEVAGEVVGEIEKGMVLLICAEKGDDKKSVDNMVQKLLKIRIFNDEQGRMNNNILQSQGSILAISQFTLSWDGKKGNRPSFDNSMPPEAARELFEYACKQLAQSVNLATGRFGTDMKVSIENDGPVTFSLSF